MSPYVYLIRLVMDEYKQPHSKAFVDRELANKYFDNDVKFYRRTGWDVSVDDDYCGGVYTVRKASMTKKGDEGYEQATLVLEQFPIIKK